MGQQSRRKDVFSCWREQTLVQSPAASGGEPDHACAPGVSRISVLGWTAGVQAARCLNLGVLLGRRIGAT